jgi:hypothetical protein
MTLTTNSTVQLLDTEIQHAALLSKLSGNPSLVRDSVFVWNGVLIDKSTAIVSLLKIYCQLPVSNAVKRSLYKNYRDKFTGLNAKYLVLQNENEETYTGGDIVDIWFYRLCKAVKGSVNQRSEESIKELMIQLHS